LLQLSPALSPHLQQTFDGVARLLQSDPRQLEPLLRDIEDQLSALAPDAKRGGPAGALLRVVCPSSSAILLAHSPDEVFDL
jgi:hypothetical protein